jgi:uncharacterized protein YggE
VKAKLAPMFMVVVAALAVLAVACGSSGTGVTVEKGLAAAVGQYVEGEAAPEAASPGLALGAEAGAPPAVSAPLGARSSMSGVFTPPEALASSAQGAVGGVTVQGFGRATAPADTARVQFVVMKGSDYYPKPLPSEPVEPIPEGSVPGEIAPAITLEVYPTPVPRTPLTEEDLEPLIEAIKAEGVSQTDIEVTIYLGGGYYGYYGPEDTARVAVTLRDMDKVGPVVEAGTAAVNETGALLFQNVGVVYRVDDCDELLAEARRAAIDDGRDNGKALAEALGVSRGDLLAAYEYSYDPIGYGGCTQDAYYYGPYEYEGPPYDPAAPAEVQIVSNVTLTFAIQ